MSNKRRNRTNKTNRTYREVATKAQAKKPAPRKQVSEADGLLTKPKGWSS